MKEFTDLINKAIEKIKSVNSTIQIVHHYDCDGITSAAIIASVLIQLEKNFQITSVKRIKTELLEGLKKKKPELVIFADVGSGYLDVIENLDCNIIILDHHQTEGSCSEKIIHINPENFGMHFSGAGTAYILAKEILKNNSLAPLAIVGTIGDLDYSANSKIFESPEIEIEKGLNLFGRFSRPLYKTLELAGIPGIDEESKAIQFLAEIGISLQSDGEWRTLSDLNDEEKRRLSDAIVKEHLRYGDFKREEIFSYVLTLKNFPKELQDVKEFAAILNACGRMEDCAIGVAVCLGSKRALEIAKGLMKGYKRMIANYIEWLKNNQQSIIEKEFASYILAKNYIHENFIGTIISMLFKKSEKPIIGLAYAEDGIKVSARSKDVDINKVIKEASEICGGSGGGHELAAGATVPFEAEEKFIENCEKLLKEKFIKV